ncbi:MAG: tRNA guanosine(34) transglycosylase Tgt [Patescibacteria group bacterium]
MFAVGTTSKNSAARTGTLTLGHGVVETPCFMTIATKGAVKTIDVPDLNAAGAEIILSNTYHLMLRPGVETLTAMGGLHAFMGWQKPILTDSGGYQVLSLASMRKVSDDGVVFRSHIDGSTHLLTPEKSQEVQQAIGSDIAMILDDLVDFPVTEQQAAAALERTLGWAKRQRMWWDANKKDSRKMFGIVQGSIFPNLRHRSAEELIKIGFDGYAHGGLSVGEPRAESYALTELVNNILPQDKPRYWMGAGQPHEIVEYVKRGCDMFDCVLPTRNARHGTLYVWKDAALLGTSSDFYELLHITNEKHVTDAAPIDATCGCFTCTHHSRAYIRHLFSVDEPLAQRLTTIHNVYFYQELMRKIREGITNGGI